VGSEIILLFWKSKKSYAFRSFSRRIACSMAGCLPDSSILRASRIAFSSSSIKVVKYELWLICIFFSWLVVRKFTFVKVNNLPKLWGMFLENSITEGAKRGWIEVICGSMFSGKTEELIRRLKRAKFANQRVEIFKPQIDTRYSEAEVVSHDANSILSTPVTSSRNISLMVSEVDVVGIDEAQFFDAGLVEVCNQLADQGIRVIVAGLDMDFRGMPFGPMPAIIATAEYVTKVHAICMQCGNLAQFSHRKTMADKLVVLGEKDIYEPLCRSCFIKATAKQK
jgi:thymidine kinase